MPYKDKEEQLSYNKQWKLKNKDKVKKYQLFHQSTYRNKKYQLSIDELQNLPCESQKRCLLDLQGAHRQALLRRMNNPELSQDIEDSIQQRRKNKIKKRYNNNWNFVKNWMIEQGCSCGEKEITKLSFHHLDPLEKDNEIRKLCKYNMKKVLNELKKGVTKCKNCHTIIHSGSSEEREKILINQYLKKTTDRKYRYRRKNKLLIWELKKSLSCIKCGTKYPVILLFHHIDNKLKKEKICLMYKTSRGVINKEIAKTVCLCHNCHEDFHYIYGRKDNSKSQLEKYIDKKVILLKVDIRDYLPIFDQKISEFYNLPFLIT